MVPCITCKTGTYQSEYGATQCNNCPDGTWTTIAGAESADKCIRKYSYTSQKSHKIGLFRFVILLW